MSLIATCRIIRNCIATNKYYNFVEKQLQQQQQQNKLFQYHHQLQYHMTKKRDWMKTIMTKTKATTKSSSSTQFLSQSSKVAVVWSYNNSNNQSPLLQSDVLTITKTINSTTTGINHNHNNNNNNDTKANASDENDQNQTNVIQIQLEEIPTDCCCCCCCKKVLSESDDDDDDDDDSNKGSLMASNVTKVEGCTMDDKIQHVEQKNDDDNDNDNDNNEKQHSNGNNNNNMKPELVLQYERQMRKAQHSKKVGQILSIQDHLRIVYVDQYIVVINKPSGILTVPGINQRIGSSISSLVHAMFGIENGQVTVSQEHMIVHRLDMDTSGLVLFGRTINITKLLQEQFRTRLVYKEYECLVVGHVKLPKQAVELFTEHNNTNTNNVPLESQNYNNNIHEEHDQHDQQEQQQLQKNMLQGSVINMPMQRDHVNPPFMRISTPQSEQEAIQTVDQLQTHGWKKLIRKNPKQCQTRISQVVEYGYYNTSTSTTNNNNTSTSTEQNDDNDDNTKLDSEQKQQVDVPVGDNTTTTTCTQYQQLLPYTRLRLQPITGRTHQLRVHCAAIGYPIVGDPAYSLHGESSIVGGLHDIHQYWKSPIDTNTTTSTSTTNKDIIDSTYIPVERCPISIQESWINSYPINVKPMCLHARILQIQHPITGQVLRWDVPPEF